MWNPHIYERKWKKFVGTITFQTNYCRIYKLENVKYTSTFDIKKCIFCEREKFRVSQIFIDELTNTGKQEVFKYLWDGLIELKKNIFGVKKFFGTVHFVNSKTNEKMIANNRIKKLYI